jgi:hypothetical protein
MNSSLDVSIFGLVLTNSGFQNTSSGIAFSFVSLQEKNKTIEKKRNDK